MGHASLAETINTYLHDRSSENPETGDVLDTFTDLEGAMRSPRTAAAT